MGSKQRLNPQVQNFENVIAPITPYVRHKCETLIQHGNQLDVKYYRHMARLVLQNCNSIADADELWPFGENPSSLCYAVWRVEAASVFLANRKKR